MNNIDKIIAQVINNAVIFMVYTNLQKDNILPSERTVSNKMKLDAIKRQ